MMRHSLFTISFKRIGIFLFSGLCAVCFLCSCGQTHKVKVIDKSVDETVNDESVPELSTVQEDTVSENASEEADGYFFLTSGIRITTDILFEEVYPAIGKENNYFEAPSCAFNGLDKYYTYDHFEIDTYPESGKDYISSIVLKDDIVTTEEGVALGSTKDEVISAYGEDYETNGSSIIYTKNGTHLTFVFNDDTVRSISYDTTKLDTNVE